MTPFERMYQYKMRDTRKKPRSRYILSIKDDSYSFTFNLEQNQPSKGVFNLYWWSANDPIYIAQSEHSFLLYGCSTYLWGLWSDCYSWFFVENQIYTQEELTKIIKETRRLYEKNLNTRFSFVEFTEFADYSCPKVWSNIKVPNKYESF
jgi:hypothetical protein